MNIDKRNKLLHRIMSDYFIIYINNKKYIIKRPTRYILNEAQLVYEKTLTNNKFNNWASENRCLAKLIQSGKWPIDGDKRIIGLEEILNNLKVQLYQSILQSEKIKKIRKQLIQVEKALNNLHEIKHSLDSFTNKGFAYLAQQQFIILSTLYNTDNQLLSNFENISHGLMEKIRFGLIKQSINSAQFRELARTNPWRLYWGISDNPFGKSVVELDYDKRALITYSKMYDNIYENPECPDEKVIEDDDMLDGWMILQKQDRDEKKKEKTLDSTVNNLSSKYQNASEIFLPAKSMEDINQINKMNTVGAKIVKQQRQNMIKKQGQVGHGKLPDVVLEQNAQAQQQMKNRIKSS